MSVRCLGFFLGHLILVSCVSHFHIHPHAMCIRGKGEGERVREGEGREEGMEKADSEGGRREIVREGGR